MTSHEMSGTAQIIVQMKAIVILQEYDSSILLQIIVLYQGIKLMKIFLNLEADMSTYDHVIMTSY